MFSYVRLIKMIDEDVKIGDDGYRGKVSGQSSFVADSSQRHTQQKAKGAKENMTCSLIHCMLGTLKAKGAPTRLRLTCNNVPGMCNTQCFVHTYVRGTWFYNTINNNSRLFFMFRAS